MLRTRFLLLAWLVAVPLSAADSSAAPAAAFEQGLKLAQTGQCAAAMPYLNKPAPRTLAVDLRKNIGLNRVRCAMSLNQPDSAVEGLRTLTRDFPSDPEVLYLAVHVYSDLSVRASQELLFKVPDSPQVHQLNAEALEAQGKWDEAAFEYRAVLEKNPQTPGIHYRLGRLMLSKPRDASTTNDARKEFEAELAIDPSNAGAEFVLGELARQAEQWDEAISHFSKAAKLDVSFADAFLGLGRSLLAEGRTPEAIPPLETAAKLQPANPTMHYELAIAYRRAGRKADAEREETAHRETTEKAQQTRDNIQRGVSGGVTRQ